MVSSGGGNEVGDGSTRNCVSESRASVDAVSFADDTTDDASAELLDISVLATNSSFVLVEDWRRWSLVEAGETFIIWPGVRSLGCARDSELLGEKPLVVAMATAQDRTVASFIIGE